MTLKSADLFCGAGGTSQGAEDAGADVVFAVNHWDIAVQTHSANFPGAKHINSRLNLVRPGECPAIDLLFASPECTHHSRARGGKPTSDQQRSGAWDIMPWIEYHRPSFIVIENVREFEQWGPVAHGKPMVSRRGAFFQAWVKAIEAAGYTVDWQILNAADYGAATSRERLFVVACKGRRQPKWPEPTHGKTVGGELAGMQLSRWRSAMEIIDWSIPCRSVFSRVKPLADKTLARIEAGLRKFVGPFVARLRNNGTADDLGAPLSTITAGGNHHGFAVPFQYQGIGLGAGRSRSVHGPIPTIVAARENHGVAVPFIAEMRHQNRPRDPQTEPLGTLTTGNNHGVAVPFIQQLTHGGRLIDPQKPLPTITTAHGGESAVCIPYIVSYYSNGHAIDVNDPLLTISTKPRCGLVTAIVELAPSIEARSEGERLLIATMQELGVADIGFRMLANHELSAAQGFPRDYIFHGTKTDVTRQIGNSVSPNVAKAITLTLEAA
ncbi:MAG: DNA cytosine methyltransferase [Planctomycetaceae bacterium]